METEGQQQGRWGGDQDPKGGGEARKAEQDSGSEKPNGHTAVKLGS